jgi:NAD(P)-dependent dehydrogenase (short-subunit alcohol dehydrogenase family)
LVDFEPAMKLNVYACIYSQCDDCNPGKEPRMASLKDNVAVVTGASRGAGRAIAAVLGEAGATVYVTGRTVRGAIAVDGLPGTVEDTAEEVTARGGNGVAVRCDHTNDADVEALFERVRAERERLDLLVNNVWGGYEGQMMGLPKGPFWEQPRGQWESMFVAGVRAHLVASQLATPLMIGPPLPLGEGQQCRGLIVSTVGWAYGDYLANLCYDVSKAAIIRMIHGMAHELRPFGVAAIALAPGFMRTERIMAVHAAHPFDLGWTESPEYAGRAVRALAEDDKLMEKSGQILTVGDLAREYCFTDVDGRQPAAFRFPGT